jgi:Transcriptional regulators
VAEQSCMYLIHSCSDAFSAKEQRVAEYISLHPSEAVHPSIDELAARIGVSVSTLLRFVKKLGYGSYQEFRIALATETLKPESRYYEIEVGQSEDPVGISCRASRAALDMTEKLVDRACLKEVSALACKATCVCLFGLGGSGLVARDALHKLIRSGIRCQSAEDFHLQLMMASQMGREDLAILISHTGTNKDSLAIADVVRRNDCPLAVITTYPRSPLARMADYLLVAGAPGSSVISEAFSARIAHLAIIDSLYIEVMEELKSKGLQNMEKMRSAIAGRRI